MQLKVKGKKNISFKMKFNYVLIYLIKKMLYCWFSNLSFLYKMQVKKILIEVRTIYDFFLIT